mmetsp:Transcript_1762/g.2246  ORF Transcript_1762/g.2246 Transcript_1762/m.2246 type:complete len:145 (+) Transcript_1762:1036-1470(+)
MTMVQRRTRADRKQQISPTSSKTSKRSRSSSYYAGGKSGKASHSSYGSLSLSYGIFIEDDASSATSFHSAAEAQSTVATAINELGATEPLAEEEESAALTISTSAALKLTTMAPTTLRCQLNSQFSQLTIYHHHLYHMIIPIYH